MKRNRRHIPATNAKPLLLSPCFVVVFNIVSKIYFDADETWPSSNA